MLELKNIEKRFGSQIAADQVSFSVNSGEFFSLLGPSGCGKSTLLRIISGLERPNAGEILLNGQSLLNIPVQKRPTHMVFQRYALFPHLNVFNNIAFGLRAKKTAEKQVKDRVERIVQLMSLSHLMGRPITNLSGGEQQRVALARALVNEPAIVLLDEPFSALDRHLRLQIHKEVRFLQKQTGITFILVTHDQQEAMSLSDRIAVMNNGRILQVDQPKTVYNQPATRKVAEFFGQNQKWQAQVTKHDSSYLQITLSSGMQFKGKAIGNISEKVECFVRPENVKVNPNSNSSLNCFLASLKSKRHLGIYTEYEWLLANGQTLLSFDGNESWRDGEKAYLSIDPDHIMLFPVDEK